MPHEIPTSGSGFEGHLDASLERAYIAAFRILRDPDAARDAVQEASARALSARDRYAPERPFYPWFYTILKNLCFDWLQRRNREAPADPVVLERPDTKPDAEHLAIASERQRTVARAIERMDDDLRELIELRHFQDLSYQEIADILGCPIGTVMSRLYRARKALRALLLRESDFRADDSLAKRRSR